MHFRFWCPHAHKFNGLPAHEFCHAYEIYITALKRSAVRTYRTFISDMSTNIRSKFTNIRDIIVPVKRHLGTYWFDLKFSQIWGTYEFRAESGTRVVPNPTVQKNLHINKLIGKYLTYAFGS